MNLENIKELAQAIMEYLRVNGDPHMSIVIDQTGAELKVLEARFLTAEPVD